MKIHEYQGKEILKKFGVPVPRSIAVFGVDEAVAAAETLGGSVWVVKAQIHAGGRGKGGGVKVAKSLAEVRQRALEILGMQLVTHQTGPAGQKVRRLLIEEGADIRRELYVGMVVDRVTQRVALMASSEGGRDKPRSWTDIVSLVRIEDGWRVNDIAYSGTWDGGNRGTLSETLKAAIEHGNDMKQ